MALTYKVVTADYELDERVDDLCRLIRDLDILYDNAPATHELMLRLVLVRVLLIRLGLRWRWRL